MTEGWGTRKPNESPGKDCPVGRGTGGKRKVVVRSKTTPQALLSKGVGGSETNRKKKSQKRDARTAVVGERMRGAPGPPNADPPPLCEGGKKHWTQVEESLWKKSKREGPSSLARSKTAACAKRRNLEGLGSKGGGKGKGKDKMVCLGGKY